LTGELSVLGDLDHLPCHFLHIKLIYQEPCHSLLNDIGNSRMSRTDHGQARNLGFQNSHWCPLVIVVAAYNGVLDKTASGFHQGGHGFVGLNTHQFNCISNSSRLHKLETGGRHRSIAHKLQSGTRNMSKHPSERHQRNQRSLLFHQATNGKKHRC